MSANEEFRRGQHQLDDKKLRRSDRYYDSSENSDKLVNHFFYFVLPMHTITQCKTLWGSASHTCLIVYVGLLHV